MSSEFEVRAAGGVVVREHGAGVELLLVHRPKYDDWSFPKGKLDDGESFREAAVREVLEETSLRCSPIERLPDSVYRDSEGRLKLVRYWLMAAGQGDPEARPADAEVDAARWLPLAAARARLTYPRDRELAETAARAFDATRAEGVSKEER